MSSHFDKIAEAMELYNESKKWAENFQLENKKFELAKLNFKRTLNRPDFTFQDAEAAQSKFKLAFEQFIDFYTAYSIIRCDKISQIDGMIEDVLKGQI